MRQKNEENGDGNPCTLSNGNETVGGNFKPRCFHTIRIRCISCLIAPIEGVKILHPVAVPLSSAAYMRL